MVVYVKLATEFIFILIFLVHLNLVPAQLLYGPQTDTFNSAAAISKSQREQAGTDDTVANNVAIALNFERSNWASGSVAEDEFYRVPRNTSGAPAGTLLKVQLFVNISAYTLPPNTALSRIMFQIETLNGSTVPASAYILWPYSPRVQLDGYPIIGWGHGTSGVFGDSLQGYVVVAPDYAGLCIVEDAEGNAVKHTWLASPGHANDMLYSVQAAQSAFKELSKNFVVMGHSQGGGAAWAAAQRQAVRPVKGYLGSIAASPVTSALDLAESNLVNGIIGPWLISQGLSSIFPDFDPGEFLTSSGRKRSALLAQIQGCNSVVPELLDPSVVRPTWSQSPYATDFDNLTSNGGRPIVGPLLILQGENDTSVLAELTTKAANKTCDIYPDSQLEYTNFAGVTHTLVMYASQRTWLGWLEQRFANVDTPRGCRRSRLISARPYQFYQPDLNWFIEYATEGYETA